MIQTGTHSYKYLLRYELRDEKSLCTGQIANLQGDLDVDL